MINYKEHISYYLKKKKLNIFLVFLTLALVFSVLTKLSTNYTKTIVFTIKPINLPEDKVVASTSQSITITLNTYGFKLVSYYFKTPSITIDFSNLQKNKTHYIWTARQDTPNVISQFDAKIKVTSIMPDTLMFSYGTNTIKQVPVIANKTITFLSGFNLTTPLKIKPDSVKLIGAKALIDTINAVYTEHITIENVNKNINTKVKLKHPNATKNLKLLSTEVSLKGEVEKFTEGLLDIPVLITNIPKTTKIKFYPKTIPVTFSASLNNYKFISPNNFKIECDYSDLKENATYLIPKITEFPSRVKHIKMNVKRVEFILVQ